MPLPAAATTLDFTNDTVETSAAVEFVQVSEELIPQHTTGGAEVARVLPTRTGDAEANARSVQFVRRGNPVIGGLVLLWLAGMLVGLVRPLVWAGGNWRCYAARNSRLTWRALLRRWNERGGLMGVAEIPPVVTSTSVRGPIVAGLLRPRIVLPAGLAESISEPSLCDVLVHECAHVVRGDAWVGLLQRLAAPPVLAPPLHPLRQPAARAGPRRGLR